jgi:hypothetical protein
MSRTDRPVRRLLPAKLAVAPALVLAAFVALAPAHGGGRSIAAPVSRPTVTPAATATAPIGTAVPTPAAVATPIAAADGVELLSYRAVPAPAGGVDVLGELRNATAGWVRPLTTTVTFFDPTGEVVGVAGVAPLVALAAPGETMPVRGHGDLDPGSWARTEVALGGAHPADRADRRVYAAGLTLEARDDGASTDARLVVSGRLVNGGEAPALYPAVFAAVFDARGHFVAWGEDHPALETVLPGQTVPFALTVPVDAGPGWTYRLLFDALAGEEG